MREIRQILLVAAGVLSSIFLVGCGDQQPESSIEVSSRPVKLIEISSISNESTARYPASISATQQTDLSFQVGGLIDEIPVNESENVEEGAVIASLDSRDFQSSIDSAQAAFNNAEDEYNRAARLAEQDAIAKSVLEQRESQRDIAKAQLESTEKALLDSVLRAPFAGVVASVSVRESQTISAGTSVATIINMDSLDAAINLPASVIAQVPTRNNQKAAVVLESVPDSEIEAVFKEANLVADATSQTYAVTFTFSPPEDILILPGMNATVILRSSGVINDESNAVTVPLAAVQSDGGGEYVWVVDPSSMTVSRQSIDIEQGIGETVVVTAGLSTGDQIVGAGAAYLAEGMKVTSWKK